MALSKKQLAIELSQLKVFENPKAKDEQYPTDSEVASDALWHALMSGQLEGKTVADLGCGTGILGIGALLCGAAHVIFLDTDKDALETLKQNLDRYECDNYEIVHADVTTFARSVDIVIQNPPFGTKVAHADKKFLETAMKNAPLVYSFHKLSTESFVRAISSDFGFTIKECLPFAFPLKQTQKFHKRALHRIEVGCYVLTKDTTIDADKATIRSEMKQMRAELPDDERTRRTQKIIDELTTMDSYKQADTVFCYVDAKGEVGTKKLIEKMLKEGKRVVVPKCIDDKMIPVEINELSELVEGSHGIMEPQGHDAYSGQIDLAVVPMVAADEQRNRLGMGKGHYDRFLASNQADSVGLAYEFQKVDEVPTNQYDKKVKKVIYG